jgi:serine/threonine protein kinase
MGTVYRAIDETLHREVAIKVLNAELNDPEVARRFRGEAITVARLSHPGIATIYELFQHEGQWLMVMEFVRGETLEHMIERTGGISPQRAAELCMQSLAALAHAHSMGVVHRDLKPANLMITENGSIKVMDFGIARVSGSEHLTNAGFMMGTPAYMAPEQVQGGEVDARADLYAMGVVFYRLTTAALPFKGETPFALSDKFKAAQRTVNLSTALNFVSTVDGCPGSSGAPIFSREGSLVGVLFDGNQQEVPSIYAYIPADASGRSIAVHSSAILASLEKIYFAKSLLEELRAGNVAPEK